MATKVNDFGRKMKEMRDLDERALDWFDDKHQTNGEDHTLLTISNCEYSSIMDMNLSTAGSWEPKLPLLEFTYNNSYQESIGIAPYEALYERKYRSPVYWDEVEERAELRPDIVSQIVELVVKIRDMMKTSRSRQKSYADHRCRDLEFALGDHVFMKFASMKGMIRFGKKGKLSLRFIGSFEILKRVGTLAYRVALPSNLAEVHDVFNVSMLRKYMSNPSHVMNYEPLQLTSNLSFEERPTQILDRQEMRLRNKDVIHTVKVKKFELRNLTPRLCGARSTQRPCV
ncbi:uncharacterized protein [Primulina huaijiensis]|uniref:uncharacterized protein n=1 Tax=Primulina huaijiensis TaxID=1492673 RepID=UPI003CC774D4